jgi:hypothetical protein
MLSNTSEAQLKKLLGFRLHHRMWCFRRFRLWRKPAFAATDPRIDQVIVTGIHRYT